MILLLKKVPEMTPEASQKSSKNVTLFMEFLKRLGNMCKSHNVKNCVKSDEKVKLLKRLGNMCKSDNCEKHEFEKKTENQKSAKSKL